MIAEWFNRITVYNKAVLHDAVEKRRKDQALVTVSNHRSCIDDPVIWGNTLQCSSLPVSEKAISSVIAFITCTAIKNPTRNSRILFGGILMLINGT